MRKYMRGKPVFPIGHCGRVALPRRGVLEAFHRVPNIKQERLLGRVEGHAPY
jgi:hypothetical protein